MQLRSDGPCGLGSSSAVGVVYQRFGSQTDEKCQQREKKKKKVAERKFSLKDESHRADLKIHGSGEGCVLCQDTNQLNHRTAFCSQPLLWRGRLPSAQGEEEEKVWEEEEKVSFYLNICLKTCKECVKKKQKTLLFLRQVSFPQPVASKEEEKEEEEELQEKQAA